MNSKEGFFTKPATRYFPVIILLFTMISYLGTSSALAATGVAGDYTVNRSYSYGSGYTVSLKSYDGNDTQLELPTTVTMQDKEYPITNTGNFLQKSQKSSITSITIPEGYTTIDAGTFENCTALQAVKLPASMRMISANAFAGCSALTSVEIADGDTPLRINNAAFSDCTALESITLPARLSKSDGTNVFYGCSALKEALISGGENYINDDQGALYAVTDKGLQLVTYPEKKTTGDFTLPSVVGEKKVTALGPHALRGNTTLEKFTVPASITSFDRFSISHCSNLKTLILEGNPPLQVDSGAFRNMATGSKIFVSHEEIKTALEEDSTEPYTPTNTSIAVTQKHDDKDVNRDGTLDLLDIATVQQHYKAVSTEAQWDKAKVADINHDNQVDMEDLVLLYTAIYK